MAPCPVGKKSECCMHGAASIPSSQDLDLHWSMFGQFVREYDLDQPSSKPNANARLSWSEHALDNLQSIIRHHERVLDELCAIRDKLERNIVGYDWIVSPLRAFPAEILEEIFKLAVVASDRPIVLGSKPKVIPLQLALVCRHWYNVITALPDLWCNIVWQPAGQYDRITPYELKYSDQALAIALIRSAPRLLSLDWSAPKETPPSDATTAFLHCVPHSFRWQNLRVSLSASSIWKIASAVGSNKIPQWLPNLEKLHLEVRYHGREDPQDSIKLFAVAPKLRSVTFKEWISGDCFYTSFFGPQRSFSPSLPDLPWSQLEELVWEGSQDLHMLLRKCTQLRALSIIGDLEGEPWGIQDTSIRLHALHTFSATFPTDDSEEENVRHLSRRHILKHLVTPGLENLELKCFDSLGQKFPILQVRDWIVRSSCALKTLALSNIIVSATGWQTFISSLSSLEKLSLHEDSSQSEGFVWKSLFPAELFRSLVPTAENTATTPLLPKLEELTVSTDWDDDKFPFEALFLAIKSRTPISSLVEPLKKVSLTLPPNVKTSQSSELAELTASGILVQLNFPGDAAQSETYSNAGSQFD